MSVFKSLRDRVQAKKKELEREAAKKAAEKAAEVAIERAKRAAGEALETAGEALRSAGASIEGALFGPDSEPQPGGAEARRERADDSPAPAPRASSERRRPETQAAKRADDEARFQREVDDELAALKRKLAKK